MSNLQMQTAQVHEDRQCNKLATSLPQLMAVRMRLPASTACLRLRIRLREWGGTRYVPRHLLVDCLKVCARWGNVGLLRPTCDSLEQLLVCVLTEADREDVYSLSLCFIGYPEDLILRHPVLATVGHEHDHP